VSYRKNYFENKWDMFSSTNRSFGQFLEWNSKIIEASLNVITGAEIYWKGVMQQMNDFMAPSWNAIKSFTDVEGKNLREVPSWDTAREFIELLQFNVELITRGYTGSLATMSDYHLHQMKEALDATRNSFFGGDAEDIVGYTRRQLQFMDLVVNAYPKAIRDIKSEYGIHSESGGYIKVAETERFELYQVLPSDKNIRVREDGKPILVLPPYVLGPNILAFLPGKHRSYIHSFADQGIPTYIRVLKNIDTTPAVQLMTGEDDASDTRIFCGQIMGRHGKPVTLNGYCQGGFMAVVDILSGELDGLVDALITCVAPMDGSRSKALVEYIQHLPPRFRKLGYAVKKLPNGNRVVDGKVISWVYKLKSMETEAPLYSFYRDMRMFEKSEGPMQKIKDTAAAINHWLIYDRSDLPLAITQLSFDSYTKPVDKHGTLPVKLFGRTLNFKSMEDKGIKWLICIGERDELVDAPAALAPLDYVDAEVTVFPKGHGAIATTWSLPTSAYALQKSFDVSSPGFSGRHRGPVRFQLDLEDALMDEAFVVEALMRNGFEEMAA